jgi:hypothetical protein
MRSMSILPQRECAHKPVDQRMVRRPQLTEAQLERPQRSRMEAASREASKAFDPLAIRFPPHATPKQVSRCYRRLRPIFGWPGYKNVPPHQSGCPSPGDVDLVAAQPLIGIETTSPGDQALCVA